MKNTRVMFLKLIFFLSILFASHALLYAQEKDQESVEEIKPPIDEDWIEPGDKELYTLKLNCITPKTGITGGVLIYYGIYIKPPYELKIVNATLLINNLPYYGPSDFRKRVNEKWLGKIRSFNISKEQKEYLYRMDRVISEIETKHYELKKKYKDDYENKNKEVMEELRIFLKKHTQIESFKISPGIVVEFKIKNSLEKNMYSLLLRKNFPIIKDPNSDPPASESDKRYLETLLGKTLVEKYQSELNPFSSIDTYLQAAFILKSNLSDLEKIKKLYQLLGDLDKAKLVFHNFNYEEFLADFGGKKANLRN